LNDGIIEKTIDKNICKKKRATKKSLKYNKKKPNKDEI
jgi:hypothetical protein